MILDKKPNTTWIIPLMFCFGLFYSVTQSASFEMYRAVDIVRLFLSGACFGVAVVGMYFMLGAWRP